ncbi:hypothetical protein [Vibrio phage VCPH]|nr:hypothetical protein [Vibrio phage VCPH]
MADLKYGEFLDLSFDQNFSTDVYSSFQDQVLLTAHGVQTASSAPGGYLVVGSGITSLVGPIGPTFRNFGAIKDWPESQKTVAKFTAADSLTGDYKLKKGSYIVIYLTASIAADTVRDALPFESNEDISVRIPYSLDMDQRAFRGTRLDSFGVTATAPMFSVIDISKDTHVVWRDDCLLIDGRRRTEALEDISEMRYTPDSSFTLSDSISEQVSYTSGRPTIPANPGEWGSPQDNLVFGFEEVDPYPKYTEGTYVEIIYRSGGYDDRNDPNNNTFAFQVVSHASDTTTYFTDLTGPEIQTFGQVNHIGRYLRKMGGMPDTGDRPESRKDVDDLNYFPEIKNKTSALIRGLYYLDLQLEFLSIPYADANNTPYLWNISEISGIDPNYPRFPTSRSIGGSIDPNFETFPTWSTGDYSGWPTLALLSFLYLDVEERISWTNNGYMEVEIIYHTGGRETRTVTFNRNFVAIELRDRIITGIVFTPKAGMNIKQLKTTLVYFN